VHHDPQRQIDRDLIGKDALEGTVARREVHLHQADAEPGSNRGELRQIVVRAQCSFAPA